jgi:hypothetical protein
LILDAATLNAGLPALGYRHHAFISYARARLTSAGGTMAPNLHAGHDPFRARTLRLKKRLEQELAQTFNNPSVFADSDIPDSALWQQDLATALYRSVVVIAVCDPVYFVPDREWCAREWRGAEEEHQRRPMVNGRGVLIYATTSKPGSSIYPAWAQQRQAADLSAIALKNWSARALGSWMAGLHDHILGVASHWVDKQVAASNATSLPPASWPNGPGPSPRYPLAA